MFFGMMRVKNESRWIMRGIRSLIDICDVVFVMDDHSTDRTVDIVRAVGGCTILESPFHTLAEDRDKTWLLGKICQYVPTQSIDGFGINSPHWVICIDGDEEIIQSPETEQSLLFFRRSGVVSYSFQILTLYDRPDQIRVDPPYDKLYRPSMFRLIKPGMVFRSSARHGGGFHCGNVPADIGFGVTLHEPVVKVKHYGYMGKADREKKYTWYVERDLGHEDWYRKECHGEPELRKLEEVL